MDDAPKSKSGSKKGPRGQFLTAVFELRPTKRKAAVLSRIRNAAENAFWESLAAYKDEVIAFADAIAVPPGPDIVAEAERLISKAAAKRAIEDLQPPEAEKKSNKTIVPSLPQAIKFVLKGRVQSFVRAKQNDIYNRSRRFSMASMAADGVVRDVMAAISSYIGLRLEALPAEYPERKSPEAYDTIKALHDFIRTIDKASEDAARDRLTKTNKRPANRGICFPKSNACRIIRDRKGRLAVALALVPASKRPKTPKNPTKNQARALRNHLRYARIRDGFDATTGELVEAMESRTFVVIPIACSTWHENKFLNGKASLKSAIVVERNSRWFLNAQFEMPHAFIETGKSVLGIDRGVVNPVAMALVDGTGAVVGIPGTRGDRIGRIIVRAEDRRRSQQRRRNHSSLRIVRQVDQILHEIANEIVAHAKSAGASVAFEDLEGLKKTIVSTRPKFSRKKGWRKILKKAQFGKLEEILSYKLKLAGLPGIRYVNARGTSVTCPACGLNDGKNRPEQAVFACVGCGFTSHADENAAVAIARRGVYTRNMKKGDKLDRLHMNMVKKLRLRDDGGLGPLASRQRVVVAHASAGVCQDMAGTCMVYASRKASAGTDLAMSAGQKVTKAGKNASNGVFAARTGRVFRRQNEEVREAPQRVTPDRSRTV